MKKSVIACSGGKHIAKKIAKKINANYSELFYNKFPDNEIDIRFLTKIKGKEIILIQSFYENLNDKIIETLFAAYTAKELGAKKIELIAPYFPYFRKDKRFKTGDCISSKVIEKLFSIFDKIYVIDPHLHRIKQMNKILKNGEKISSLPAIINYIEKLNIKNKFFIGPDNESEQWAEKIAKGLNAEFSILTKIRYNSKNVKIKINKINIKNKNIIIVDDIISSGETMLETIKNLKKMKPKKIYCIGIHGLFTDKKILKEIKKNAKVISTNTVPSLISKIDISTEIIKNYKNKND